MGCLRDKAHSLRETLNQVELDTGDGGGPLGSFLQASRESGVGWGMTVRGNNTTLVGRQG